GQTGTGKSSFANKVVGSETAEVGHSLKSCTSSIRILRHSSSPPNPDFVLIDTPGFNDTNLSDVQVLETITDWLSATYRKDVILAGVLYFHRISDIRFTSTERQNIAIFESLVGKAALENVIIVSTMWDEIKEEEAKAKEKALKEEAWRVLTSKGARVARHRNTRGSALDIVWMLQGARNHRALLVQEEMVDHGRLLPQTTVGQKVAS
ncbi:P-loop containing nucleoside triphosphate hydrolase protein, partial [Panaeolus papilionaceus]